MSVMRAPAALILGSAMAVALLAASGRPDAAQAPLDWRPSLQMIPSPAADASGEPQITVSPRGALLSWIERTGTRAALRFAERTPAGWSEPRTAAAGDDWFVNWADVPSVLRLDNGSLAAHWLQKSGASTYAYDVRLSHSADDGRTWSPSVTPHHDGTKSEHGFASLFQMPGAGLALVWLDGRAMGSADGHGAHPEGPEGAMSVRFGAFDSAFSQTSEMPVDLKACECCPTTAVMTSEGPLVAYRNRSDDEVRDIHVSRFVQGAWTPPVAVHEDGWRIAACPVNGPMLSARGRDVAIAWFTAVGDAARAYVAFSHDAGRSFGNPVRLDDASTLGRVDIELMPDGSAVATWIEFANGRAQLSARRVDATGRRSAAVAVSALEGSRSSGYPRLARAGDELVFAWTETTGGASRVRTAVTAVPAP